MTNTDNQTDPMLQYKHLPPVPQRVSRSFAVMAAETVANTPRSPERTATLRKLLEAKDCAVRANLLPEVVTVEQLLNGV
jgi:hypothetical protein